MCSRKDSPLGSRILKAAIITPTLALFVWGSFYGTFLWDYYLHQVFYFQLDIAFITAYNILHDPNLTVEMVLKNHNLIVEKIRLVTEAIMANYQTAGFRYTWVASKVHENPRVILEPVWMFLTDPNWITAELFKVDPELLKLASQTMSPEKVANPSNQLESCPIIEILDDDLDRYRALNPILFIVLTVVIITLIGGGGK